MRTLVLIAVMGCTKASPTPAETAPTIITKTDIKPPVGPSMIDAGAPALTDAAPIAVVALATEIKPLAIAGPYKTLLDSCMAARPCGFTDMDQAGNLTKPPKQPSCEAALDPERDGIGTGPASMSKNSSYSKLTHKTTDGEIRLGSVNCAVPKGLRYEHHEHYVFVHRADGWWRTELPLFTYDYNEKYCGGGSYVLWNDKPGRTIIGVAASLGCLTCAKQGSREDLLELMLRVETGGTRPIVFAPLPVGARTQVTLNDPDSPSKDDPECKPTRSAVSMKENWVSDDEVILEGAGGAGGPLEGPFAMGAGHKPASAGRYRFTRP